MNHELHELLQITRIKIAVPLCRCVMILLLQSITLLHAQSGIFLELTGEVTLKIAGSDEFVQAEVGDEVYADDIVSTGFKSSAVISTGSTVITVRPLTRLSLADIRASAYDEKININLQTGRIRVEVKPPSGTRVSTQVQTPMSVAAVRGTGFEMDSQNLSVFEGSVFYHGKNGKTVSVAAGSSSSVRTSRFGSDGGAIDPVELAVKEFSSAAPFGADDTGDAGVAPYVPVTTTSPGFGFSW